MFLGSRLYTKRRQHDSTLSTPSLSPIKGPLLSLRPSSGEGIVAREARTLESAENGLDEGRKENGISCAKTKEIEIVCNGIKYQGILVEEDPIPNLICEECEKAKSVLKCEDCDQVFCAYCFEICHVRPQMGTNLHPHEQNRSVRPVRRGDISRIILDTSFKMPNYEYYEQDMIKHKDLSVPNSLAADGVLSPLSNQPCLPLKYSRGEVLVYIDPVTHQEVYGRVESEWDFRNGEVAPPLIRGGEGALSHYIIRYLGPVTPLVLQKLERDEDPTTGLSMNQSKNKESRELSKLAKLQSMPILEGVKSVQLRSERVLANRIDKRLQGAKYLRTHGPLHHLNPPVPKGFANDTDDDDVSHLSDNKESPPKDDNPQVENSTKVGSSVSKSGVKSTRPLTSVELRTQALPAPVASKRTLEGVVAAYSLIAEVEATLYPNLPAYDIAKEPPHVERMLKILVLPESALAKPSDRVKLIALRKRDNIRIALTKRFALLFEDWLKYSFQLWVEWNLEYTLRLKSFAATKIQTQYRRWLCRDIITDLQHISAERLHKQWVKVHSKFNYCSSDFPGAVTMDNKIYFASHRDVNKYSRQLRIAVSKFVRVANRQRLTCLFDTFSQWRTTVSCSKENDLKVTHCRNYAPIRDDIPELQGRQSLVYEIRMLHTQLHRDIQQSLLSPPEDTAKIDADPLDDTRFGILSLPMALQREQPSDDKGSGNLIAPPPWHPSIGFHDPQSASFYTKQASEPEGDRAPSRGKSRSGLPETPPFLPELLPLPDFVIRNKKATLDKFIKHSIADMQKYNSFKAIIAGPTDHSCWIIPGRLAMGRIPLGKAREKGPVDSIIHTYTDCLSQLLLVGINSFVSLIEPSEEEAVLQLHLDSDDIDDSKSAIVSVNSSIVSPRSMASTSTRQYGNTLRDKVKKYYKEVKMELKNHLVALQDQLETKNIQLEEYANIEEPTSFMTNEKLKRIEQQKREKLRLSAKKKLILDEIEVTKKAMEKYPSFATWSSFPLKHNTVPQLDRIIPILWELEQRLWQGECLYIYSKDGNGRAGLVCACLLGRLYGLSHTETLLRMQTYFDCQKSQYRYIQKPTEDGNIMMTVSDSVSATCPQMSRQQELVSRILMSTNRVFQGISSRSQTNPESFLTSTEYPRRGLRIVASLEQKWKTDPTLHTKSSIAVHQSSPKLLKVDAMVSSNSEVSNDIESPLQVDDVFTQPILRSIGRRSSSIVRVLPTGVATICDSPMKLRIL